MATVRTYRWAHEGAPGLEHLALTVGDDGVIAHGAVIGHRFGADYALTYRIRCDAAWHVRAVDVALVGATAAGGKPNGNPGVRPHTVNGKLSCWQCGV